MGISSNSSTTSAFVSRCSVARSVVAVTLASTTTSYSSRSGENRGDSAPAAQRKLPRRVNSGAVARSTVTVYVRLRPPFSTRTAKIFLPKYSARCLEVPSSSIFRRAPAPFSTSYLGTDLPLSSRSLRSSARVTSTSARGATVMYVRATYVTKCSTVV